MSETLLLELKKVRAIAAGMEKLEREADRLANMGSGSLRNEFNIGSYEKEIVLKNARQIIFGKDPDFPFQPPSASFLKEFLDSRTQQEAQNIAARYLEKFEQKLSEWDPATKSAMDLAASFVREADNLLRGRISPEPVAWIEQLNCLTPLGPGEKN